MPDFDPNPELRAELNAALAVITPQIRGLQDIEKLPAPAAFRSFVDAQVVSHQKRQVLILAALASLDAVVTARAALDADGYPAVDKITMPQDLFRQLTGEMHDVAAAAALFVDATAATVTVSLGPTGEKP